MSLRSGLIYGHAHLTNESKCITLLIVSQSMQEEALKIATMPNFQVWFVQKCESIQKLNHLRITVPYLARPNPTKL